MAAGARRPPWLATVLFLVRFAPALSISEVDALSNFVSGFVGSNQAFQSWDRSLPTPCTWFHVTCSTTGQVVRIDLGNQSLSGVMDASISQLRNLQSLELYSNNITGEIPSALGDLANLETLDLYLNSFTGPIPSKLGSLSKLMNL